MKEIKTLEDALEFFNNHSPVNVQTVHGRKGTYYLLRHNNLRMTINNKEDLIRYAKYEKL